MENRTPEACCAVRGANSHTCQSDDVITQPPCYLLHYPARREYSQRYLGRVSSTNMNMTKAGIIRTTHSFSYMSRNSALGALQTSHRSFHACLDSCCHTIFIQKGVNNRTCKGISCSGGVRHVYVAVCRKILYTGVLVIHARHEETTLFSQGDDAFRQRAYESSAVKHYLNDSISHVKTYIWASWGSILSKSLPVSSAIVTRPGSTFNRATSFGDLRLPPKLAIANNSSAFGDMCVRHPMTSLSLAIFAAFGTLVGSKNTSTPRMRAL